jgi:cytoskeleton protein RodZ
MKTVGEILKEARLKGSLTLEDISHQTKISRQYLEAIEQNDFRRLPPSAFTKGFMQNYAKVVRLNPKNVLAIFRRDYDQDEKGRIIPRSIADPVKTTKNWFNPTTTSLVISGIIGIIIAGFFIRQIILFNSAPELNVTEPPENDQSTSPVTVSGHTQPQATVTVNNRPVTVTESGEFTAQVPLTTGEHTLVITATSRSNRERTVQRIIFITE